MSVTTRITKTADFGPGQFQIGTREKGQTPAKRIYDVVHMGRQAMCFEAWPNEFRWNSDGTHEGSSRTEAIIPGKDASYPYFVKPGDVRWIAAWYALDPAYPWVHDPKYPNKTFMQIGMYPNPTTGSFYCGLLGIDPAAKLDCSGAVQKVPAPIGPWFRTLHRVKHMPPRTNEPAKLREGDGEIDAWIDGVAAFSGRGRTTMGPAAGGAYLKVGSYGTPIPGEVSRLWIADLVVATTRAEAESAAPAPSPTPTPADTIESLTVRYKSGKSVTLP